ncbi:MAG: hypothetical protein NG747_13305 [Candidatus Brocadia sp.]|nr:hypothetical protein [Candidatus Brocadia sp.]
MQNGERGMVQVANLNPQWIPVFKTGTHTDSSGNKKTWTEADLDKIAASYHPAGHEAPVVIGHPKDNSPAFGWVEGLKRDGNILYAKFKDLVPEFVDMVRKGLFKKRSISLYPDLGLRHVGFLGAVPPAVKGLPDVAFNDKDGIIIEFGDCKTCKGCEQLNNFCATVETHSRASVQNAGKEVKMKWFEWLKGKAVAEGVTIEDAPQNFSAQNPPPTPAIGGQLFDIEAEVAKRVKSMELEFAEKLAVETQGLASQKAALEKEKAVLAKTKAEKAAADIASFCDGLCREGKITPAMLKHGAGMQTFLERIAEITTPIEFSDGDTKKTQTPFEYVKSFLSSFKKQIEFREVAGADKDIGRGNAGEKLAALVQQKMDGNKALSYSQAFSEVQRENGELAREYAAEIYQ